MFRNILLRSFAGAVAVGSALAMSLVATPAVVTSAPELRTVACAEYPGSVSTTTQLSLARSGAIFGTANSATATVSRDDEGAKDPVGRVRFSLSNSDDRVLDSWTVGLSGGQASVSLPRRLTAQNTYTVRATYVPRECSVFARRVSRPAYYTVHKAGTSTSVNAPDVNRGQNARVSVAVGSRSPIAPGGQVRIAVERRGTVLATQTLRLEGGEVRATFRKFRVGRYDVSVRYLGTENFRSSQGSDGFRVTRN